MRKGGGEGVKAQADLRACRGGGGGGRVGRRDRALAHAPRAPRLVADGPLYAVRVVGASPAEGAFVVSAFALGALLGSLLGGYMLDAMRPLPFVVASVGLKLLGVVAAAVWLVLDSYSAMTLPALAAVW